MPPGGILPPRFSCLITVSYCSWVTPGKFIMSPTAIIDLSSIVIGSFLLFLHYRGHDGIWQSFAHPLLLKLKAKAFPPIANELPLEDSYTESGYTVAQRLRHTASASLMHFPLVFKTVSDQADSVLPLAEFTCSATRHTSLPCGSDRARRPLVCRGASVGPCRSGAGTPRQAPCTRRPPQTPPAAQTSS